MRGAGLTLLLVALFLLGARLFTGIVYRAEVPVVALVVKHRPGFAIEWAETAAEPIDHDMVIDQEEPQLVYAPLYLALMRAVPVGAPVMIVGGVMLMRRARRPA